MNNPAFRSGIARESQNISRGLSNRAIAKLEGRISKVRFDFNNPYPHESPHLHFEKCVNGKWKTLARIYPSDMPHK